tara:strand:+ start:456 stop:731 length:276 start_codon:yes stop_codon:yes gene_type:complete
MSEPIKFTEEELKKIKDLRDSSQSKIVEFGQLKLEKLLAEQRLQQIEDLDKKAQEEYIALQDEELKLVNTFKEKYGIGTVDLASGEFIPAK